MTDPKTSSTPPNSRTCSACGQRKPLIAFLELAGNHYGDICASCRGKGLGAKKEHLEVTDSSGGTTRVQLDNQAKIQREQDRQEQHKLKSELDSDEKSKKDTLSLDKTTDSEEREKAEKIQREELLSSKGNVSNKAQTLPNDQKQFSTQSFYLNKARSDRSLFQSTAETNQSAESTRSFNQDENKKTATGDVSVVATDEQNKSVGRSDESVFGRFREYLGTSGVMNRTLKQYGKKEKASTVKKPPTSFLTTTQKTKPVEKIEKTENNLASEFINNNIKRR